MSIYIYTGTPGSGKSLHAAYDVRQVLNRFDNRPVLANFELNPQARVRHPENFYYIGNDVLSPDKIIDFADAYWSAPDAIPFREEWLLVVLDEVQLALNSREWNKNMTARMEWLSLMSQSRKYGLKIILIAQADKMVDNQIRMLLEYEVKHRKLSNFGLVGWLVGMLFFGRLFLWVTTYYSMGEVLERSWYVGRRRDMEIYDSYKRFERT